VLFPLLLSWWGRQAARKEGSFGHKKGTGRSYVFPALTIIKPDRDNIQ